MTSFNFFNRFPLDNTQHQATVFSQIPLFLGDLFGFILLLLILSKM